MQVAELTASRYNAREAFLEYRKAVAEKGDKKDVELMKGYQQLSFGRKVLSLSQTFRMTGLNASLQPKLAIARADAKWVWYRRSDLWKYHGQDDATLMDRFIADFRINPARSPRVYRDESSKSIAVVGSIFTGAPNDTRIRAQVPIIPPKFRPRFHLKNYFILFEANWQAPPVDPLLLRRIGKDLFVILAHWNLTEIERAVMAAARGGL